MAKKRFKISQITRWSPTIKTWLQNKHQFLSHLFQLDQIEMQLMNGNPKNLPLRAKFDRNFPRLINHRLSYFAISSRAG